MAHIRKSIADAELGHTVEFATGKVLSFTIMSVLAHMPVINMSRTDTDMFNT